MISCYDTYLVERHLDTLDAAGAAEDARDAIAERIEAELRGLFAAGFDGAAVRLPCARYVAARQRNEVSYENPMAEAVRDAMDIDGGPMAGLLAAARPGAAPLDMAAFREAVITAYLREHLDDLVEIELERIEREEA